MTINEIASRHRDRFEFLADRKLSGEFLSKSEFMELWRLYLGQPEWIALTQKVGERCGNVCESCYDAPYQECHHLTYDNRFQEHLEDLMGVCRKCHSIFTKAQKEQKPKETMNKPKSDVGDSFILSIKESEIKDKIFIKSNLNSGSLSSLKWMGMLDYRGKKHYVTVEFDHIRKLDDSILKEAWNMWNSFAKIWGDFEQDVFVNSSGNTKIKFLCRVDNHGNPKNDVKLSGRIFHPDFKKMLKVLTFSTEQVEIIYNRVIKSFIAQDKGRGELKIISPNTKQKELPLNYKSQPIENALKNTVVLDDKNDILIKARKWFGKRNIEDDLGRKLTVEEYKEIEKFIEQY